MEISLEILEGKALLVQLDGDLIGEASGTQILDLVNESLKGSVKSCIVDLSKVRYMNSSGIGVLITILTKVKNKEGKVVLMNPTDQVIKLLEITKLNSVFNTVKTISEAKEIIE